MEWYSVATAALVLSALGVAFSVVLLVFERFFSVPTDSQVQKISDFLPGANCGACGYPSCIEYAVAVAAGEETNLCIPGADVTSIKIAEIMGSEAKDTAKSVAVVRCLGFCDVTEDKYRYIGRRSCAAAGRFFSGELACDYGCLGFGDCVLSCKFNAISIVRGIAVTDLSVCNGCGECVKVCPKNLVELLPLGKKSVVFCSSREKGSVTRKICKRGCIGCRLCVKSCRYDALRVENNLAVVDNLKCTGCGECREVCPTRSISIITREKASFEDTLQSVRAEKTSK